MVLHVHLLLLAGVLNQVIADSYGRECQVLINPLHHKNQSAIR